MGLDVCTAGGTENTNRGLSAGEPPVNSKQSAQIPRQRSRLWNHTNASVGEVDSLQNAINAFTVSVMQLSWNVTNLSCLYHSSRYHWMPSRVDYEKYA